MSSFARKIVSAWLLVGCLMVFFQVIVGGVTRLTESGLSITEWKPVKGIVPPLNEEEWQAEFELYKQLAQYKTINEGMTVEEFKWIYFWEYFHRFWARFMGFVFIIPFSFFVVKKWLDKDFFKRIGVLFLWGGLIGVYGWIMVRSGLTGIYVPPVHLSIHLVLALSLFAYLVYTANAVYYGGSKSVPSLKGNLALWVFVLLGFIFVQIFFGGIVSGMKAGLAANTWPDMNGEIIPATIWKETATIDGFLKYDAQNYWGRIFIQFIHRSSAYAILLLVAWLFVQLRKEPAIQQRQTLLYLLPLAVLLQVAIGIITVMNCSGKIPVFWGVAHQAGAMILLAVVTTLLYHLRNPKVQAG